MWSHPIIGLFGIQTWIFGTTFILAIWINSSGGVSSPNLNLIWISLCFFHECEVKLMLALYLTEGSDNSPPLKRISSRDSEVCRRKEGYSARRRSSISHVASFSEWCDHWTLRNLIFLRWVTRSAESRLRMGYSRLERSSCRSSISWSTSRMGSLKQRLTCDTWNTSCIRDRCRGS